jgi:poly(beta-D-mannuronate) lyase
MEHHVSPRLSLFALLVITAGASAVEHSASSAADIARLAPQLKPGDVVVMADGDWKDQAISLSAKGTAEQPITFRAATPGKVVVTGDSSLVVEGEYIVVSGLLFNAGRGKGDAIKLAGHHNRLTESAVTGGDYKFFVHLFGTDNQVDHCYLADKTSESPTLQVEVDKEAPSRHRIVQNHFGPRPPLGKNGGETMRVGYSHQSMSSSGTLVEHNLFDRCDGELEIISSKSCDNVYRFNTFLDCAGTLTLRHGNRCRVEGNFFIANHKKGSGGVRVIGDDHVIVNNYFDGLAKGAFWITSGIPNSPLVGYFQARNAVVAFNTVVDSKGPYIELDAGFGTSKRSLRPENITIANNCFLLPAGSNLLKGTEGERYTWGGNLAEFADNATPSLHPGIRAASLKFEKSKDGVWRPTAESPARGAAEGDAATFPKTDIDGQPRPDRPDVGCDQRSDAPVTNRPLTAADVGPTWLRRAAP